MGWEGSLSYGWFLDNGDAKPLRKAYDSDPLLIAILEEMLCESSVVIL